MKGNYGVKSSVLIIIIGIMIYIALAGLSIPGTEINIGNVEENIRYGIDIRGGVRAVLTAEEGANPTDSQMEAARQTIENRLNNKRIYDKTLLLEKSNKRIILEIPYQVGQVDQDPRKAINEIGMTAMLTFREVDPSKVDENKNYLPLDDKIVLKGDDIVTTEPELDQRTGRTIVRLHLSDEGAKKFEAATERLVGQPLAIFMDDQLISAPNVQEKISGKDSATISVGGYTIEETAKEAKALSDTINAGALPFKLVAKDLESISPILGQSALNVIMLAGLVALILVGLYILLYYRLPGIIADIAFMFAIVAQIMVIAYSHMSLTLPGIAGIILTIGMSLDGNVIIYERIKEEIRSGKTVKAAIDVGFKRAFTAIFDGNITILIAAAVLYVLGTGSIQSFAFTLALGVLLNFITCISISKTLLQAVSNFKFAKNTWLYGVKGGKVNV